MKAVPLIQRMNKLEAWLEQTGAQKPALPLLIGGYALLFLSMMILNMGALIRWPFVALYRKLKRGQGPSEAKKTANTIPEADRHNLPGILKDYDTVLLDFWAEWCGPCVLMNEPLKQLAKAEDVNCTIVKVNTVTQPGLAKKYNVKGLPTLILYRQGQEVKRYGGAIGFGGLKSFVKD